jgi:hypothetical protein
MSAKKISTILNLIEISENNLKTAKALLAGLAGEGGMKPSDMRISSGIPSNDEDSALEVVEGHFDGESMIGDNGQMYIVPPNYASKTQLVVGDRMKWILTKEREIYKLIQSVPRERVIGTFAIEGDDYLVLVNTIPTPVKILKASATYAMKNLGLQPGDEVAIIIPKDTTPTWGAFNSVVKGQSVQAVAQASQNHVEASTSELDDVSELGIDLNTQSYF